MNLKFIIHSKSNKKGENAIYLRATSQYKAVDIRTKLKISPKFWKKEQGTIKNTNAFPQGFELRNRLTQIKETAQNVFNTFIREHKEEPQPKEYKRLVENELFGTDEVKDWNLITYYEHYLQNIDAKLNQYSRPVSKGYITSHKNTLNKIKELVQINKLSVEFKDVDTNFNDLFLDYLNGRNYKNNYVGKQIKNIKTVLNEATIKGINTSLKYKVFKEIAENIDAIYLNEDELDELYNLDLSENKRLDRVRDIFLFSAWTGLRHGDYNNFNEKANIQEDVIYIKTEKSQKSVPLPLHPITRNILAKYKNKLPTLSNTKYNLYLKELGQILPCLHKDFVKEYTKGGKLVKETLPRYKAFSSHTARRSFATNMFRLEVPIQTIMAITGHAKESTFYKYIKLPPDYHAKQINNLFNERYK